MKTWIVCMDSVSLPHRHNRDLYHLIYQTHLTEPISTRPTVSLNTNGLFLVADSETRAYSHVQYNIGLWPHECKLAWMDVFGSSPHSLTSYFQAVYCLMEIAGFKIHCCPSSLLMFHYKTKGYSVIRHILYYPNLWSWSRFCRDSTMWNKKKNNV